MIFKHKNLSSFFWIDSGSFSGSQKALDSFCFSLMILDSFSSCFSLFFSKENSETEKERVREWGKKCCWSCWEGNCLWNNNKTITGEVFWKEK